MLRDDLKMLSFLELKDVLKELRYQQKIMFVVAKALETGDKYTFGEEYINARNAYFGIVKDIEKVTFRMRNIIRQNKRHTKIIKSSKEY